MGPEGPHSPGAGPLGVEPAVSLPAGHLRAALLTAGVICAAQMCRDAPWWGLSHPAEGLEPCSAPAAGRKLGSWSCSVRCCRDTIEIEDLLSGTFENEKKNTLFTGEI